MKMEALCVFVYLFILSDNYPDMIKTEYRCEQFKNSFSVDV